jgi:acetyltransferase-like isoleucine patch superfamily enzyme
VLFSEIVGTDFHNQNVKLLDRFVYRAYHRLFRRELIGHLDNKTKAFSIEGRAYFLGINKFTVGENCMFRNGISFEGNGNGHLVIGNGVNVGNNVSLSCSQEVTIGDGTAIASNCYIIDSDHSSSKGPGEPFDELICSPIHIGKNVWIGNGVTVLRGSTIGDGAITGAGAVVKGDIPANSVAVGIPAKVIKMRK